MERIPWSETHLHAALGENARGCGRSAPDLVAWYFGPFKERLTSDVGPRIGFSGKYFDQISLASQREALSPRDEDLTAVSYLGIMVDGEMYASLRAVATRVGEALSSVPGLGRESEIWDCPESWFVSGSGLSGALDIVRTLDKFGETTSRKLMSAMFPHLLSVRDSVVESVMEPVGRTGWWTSWRLACGPSLTKHLVDIRSGARKLNPDVPAELSLLRVADIAIWTAEHIKSQGKSASAGR